MGGPRHDHPLASVHLESLNGGPLCNTFPTVPVQHEELMHHEVRLYPVRKPRPRRDQVETGRVSVHKNEVRKERLRFPPPGGLRVSMSCQRRDAVVDAEETVTIGHKACFELRYLMLVERSQVLDDVGIFIIRQFDFNVHSRALWRKGYGLMA